MTVDGTRRAAARRAAALRLSRHRRSSRDDRSLHDATRRGRCTRTAGAPALLQLAGHPPLAFLRNYIARGGIRDGVARLHHLGDERVLRVPEVREAVGAAAAEAVGPLRTQTANSGPEPEPMFSLHIDTARTWRGGQNQVLLTVNGLRAIGQRAALVAHPDGELRRRAAEGLELIPIAPRTEMDLSAAWRLSRVIKRLAARRHPRARSARRRDGVARAVARRRRRRKARPAPALVASRRVDFHLKGNSFSRWKYRQVDCFIAASEAIRQMLVADGVPADRTVTVHEGIDVEHVLRRAAGQRARGVLAAAQRAGRRQRRRARAAQGPAPPDRRRAPGRAARCPTRAS